MSCFFSHHALMLVRQQEGIRPVNIIPATEISRGSPMEIMPGADLAGRCHLHSAHDGLCDVP